MKRDASSRGIPLFVAAVAGAVEWGTPRGRDRYAARWTGVRSSAFRDRERALPHRDPVCRVPWLALHLSAYAPGNPWRICRYLQRERIWMPRCGARATQICTRCTKLRQGVCPREQGHSHDPRSFETLGSERFENGADGGSRTHTPLRATEFESVASAIPPHRRTCPRMWHSGVRRYRRILG